MTWQKHGNIFTPNNHFDWMVSHAQVPKAIAMQDRFRVFFAARNAAGKSQIGLIDLALDDPQKILDLHKHPVLCLGNPGTFDEDGVMPSSVLQKGDEIWLYYTGWNQKVSTPYHNSIGLAVSTDGGYTFKRMSEGPILDRTMQEPYIAVTPYVMQTNTGYQMWYASGIGWSKVEDRFEPTYIIKYAHSKDGIIWERMPEACLLQKHQDEVICAPTVSMQDGGYQMWYSYRTIKNFRDGENSYRIGYAKSNDGLKWQRLDDQAGIQCSQDGWDDKMLCYPHVLHQQNKLYLFYNGNSFGRFGFGYATQQLDGNLA